MRIDEVGGGNRNDQWMGIELLHDRFVFQFNHELKFIYSSKTQFNQNFQ